MTGAYSGMLVAGNATISLLLSWIAATSDHKLSTDIRSPAVWPLDKPPTLVDSNAAVLAIPANASVEPTELPIMSDDSKAFFKLPDDLLPVGYFDNSDMRSALSDTVISLRSLMESCHTSATDHHVVNATGRSHLTYNSTNTQVLDYDQFPSETGVAGCPLILSGDWCTMFLCSQMVFLMPTQ